MVLTCIWLMICGKIWLIEKQQDIYGFFRLLNIVQYLLYLSD